MEIQISTRRRIFTVSIYNLHRVYIYNIDRSNKRKWLYTKKDKQTISCRNYYRHRLCWWSGDDLVILTNIPGDAKSLLHSLEKAVGSISLYIYIDKTQYMCFNKEGAISTSNGGPLKLVDKFTYLSSRISSTESDVNMCLAKAWTAIDWL